MKSLLLISRCPPYPLHLGDRLIVWHLARELVQRGWKIDLLAYANYDSDWQEKPAYAHLFRHIQLIEEPARTQLDYLKRVINPEARFPKTADSAWSPEMWQAVEAHLSAQQYDAIQLFGGVQVYELYHALGGCPAVITPYESYSLYLKRLLAAQPGLSTGRVTVPLLRLIAREYERWMFTPYARTVVIAAPDRDELREINPDLQIEVIPNGIDLNAFPATHKPRQPATLLFTGNYEYAPNIDAALTLAQQIFPQVQAKIPKAKLWLVGNAPPPELSALENDSIRVTGRVPEMGPYLSEAAVFVCPLRLGAGIKNKVLEALAAGLPVVATPVSVDGIAVQHETHALIASVENIADEVVRLLQSTMLKERLPANGRALIERQYSWGQVAAAYEALYASLTPPS